jgi:predicted dehydrogenase
MINLGVAGMGYIGRTHLEAAREVPGAQVVAASTRKASELRAKFPDLRVYPTYRELLRDERLQAVIICLPTHLHEVATLEAVERRLDVLCEKAMALDAASARRMLAAAQARGRILMVAHVLRFWPQYARIKRLIEAGEIGSVRSVTAWRLAKYPLWADWFRDPVKSGGCLLDLQIHDVDFVYWILGHPRSVYTVGVQATTGSWDHVHTTLTYARAQATTEASYLMPESWPFTTGIRVVGDRGALEYSFSVATNVQEREQASHLFRWYKSDGTVSDLSAPMEDMFSAQLRYFVSCVADRQPPRLCPPGETCQVMQVMTASRQSADSGKVITLDEGLGLAE